MRRPNRVVAGVICSIALAVPAGAQSPAPAFDLADLRVSPRSVSTSTRSSFRAGRFEARRVTLLSLITTAYGVPAAKIIGGPSWLTLERYDVTATAQPGTTAQRANEMLQSLLAARFNLKVHPDTIPQPQYALRVGKDGPRLKQADGSEPSMCRPAPVPDTVAQKIVCRNTTMAAWAPRLRSLGSYVSDPVIDATGLQGAFDFEVTIWPASAQAAAGDGDTVFTAMRKLGLELVREETPAPVLIFDSANRQPAANPPGVEKLATAPVPFEVASIKAVAPGGNPARATNVQAGGQVNLRGMTLRELIAFAWDTSSDAVFGPKVLDGDRFDVSATVPAEMPRPIDVQVVRPMVKALLQERFKVAAHEEDRSIDVDAILPPKSPSELKMKRGNENERASCVSTPSLIPANSGISAAVVCTNMTMAQFAADLKGWAPNYISHPVVDLTALDGAWNFTFMWTGLAEINGRVNARQPGDKQAALASVGTFTLEEAMERQMGVKLAQQKHPMPALVVDRAEAAPTEN